MNRIGTHESFLRYRSFLYLKVSALLVLASIATYALADPRSQRRGDTPVGYTLGILSTLLILWLFWFGVRKRRYSGAGAPLRGWLSAHVYLGTTLLVLVPLHAAFIFGANVHTLAYLLLVLVVLSGMVGVFFYATVPEQMTQNRPGETMAELLHRVAEIDRTCGNLAEGMADVFARAVVISIEQTRIGGGLLRQLRGSDPACGTARALAIVVESSSQVGGEERPAAERLMAELKRKSILVGRIRRDVRMKALLDGWLVLHVPLAFATAAAVAVHVFVVLYW